MTAEPQPDHYSYFNERQALSDRLAHISFEMGIAAAKWNHLKGLQDGVLQRIAALDGGSDE